MLTEPNSPYGLQWMWPLPLFIAIWFAPESPWWLVRKGRVEEAKKSLRRLTSVDRDTDFDADETISMMVHTTALEEKVKGCPLRPPSQKKGFASLRDPGC